MKKVLNVGGNTKDIPLPSQYAGCEHLLLDIDPRNAPDIVCDARQLTTMAIGQFDALYCSHNLEHYYRHDVRSNTRRGQLRTVRSAAVGPTCDRRLEGPARRRGRVNS